MEESEVTSRSINEDRDFLEESLVEAVDDVLENNK